MRRIERRGDARFLTFSCFRRLPLLLRPAARDEFVLHLDAVRRARGFGLLAFVIMPEHVHLMVRPNLPDDPVSSIMTAIKLPFARRVITKWRARVPPLRILELLAHGGRTRYWQRGGGYDRNVFSQEEHSEKVVYMHMNPVRRGLVPTMLDWPWSSAQEIERPGTGLIRIERWG